jgi:hypothetical protein
MEFFSSVNCGEISRQNIFSQCPSVYTDEIVLSVHTMELQWEKMEWKRKNKKNDASSLQNKILT